MKALKTSNMKDDFSRFRINCAECSGLCCIALYFSKLDGFPKDKTPGEPCFNLDQNFKCKIHSKLLKKNYRGCISYDCFGAGQVVTKQIYNNKTWQSHPQIADEIFHVFLKVYQINQILWYLIEAKYACGCERFLDEINGLLTEGNHILLQDPIKVLDFNVDLFRENANIIFKKVIDILKRLYKNKETGADNKQLINQNFSNKQIAGEDYSASCLIASDFSNSTLIGTSFLAADIRDVNFSNANIKECLFLTQGQLNSAKGNGNTILPVHLLRPFHWK